MTACIEGGQWQRVAAMLEVGGLLLLPCFPDPLVSCEGERVAKALSRHYGGAAVHYAQ